jgi:hypothetical protein
MGDTNKLDESGRVVEAFERFEQLAEAAGFTTRDYWAGTPSPLTRPAVYCAKIDEIVAVVRATAPIDVWWNWHEPERAYIVFPLSVVETQRDGSPQ